MGREASAATLSCILGYGLWGCARPTERCGNGVDDDADGEVEGCKRTGVLSMDEADAVLSDLDTTEGRGLGTAVAVADVDGDGIGSLLIGAPDLASDDGAVYLVRGPFTGALDVSAADAWISGSRDARLGQALATGDLLGEGREAIIAGGVGQVAIWLDPAMGEEEESVLITSSEDSFGSTVAWMSDVSMLVVGASGVESDAGAVYVFADPGAASDSRAADAVLSGTESGEFFGGNLADAGDLDGDGQHDLVVAATPWKEKGESSGGGTAYVFLGPVSSSAVTGNADESWSNGDNAYGSSLAAAGDTNLDGLDEVWVGSNEGLTLQSLSDGWMADIKLVAPDGSEGESVTTCDVDGDGHRDTVVGVDHASVLADEAGAAFVYYGSGAGSPEGGPADLILAGSVAGEQAGVSVACGNVNGDGADDILVGAPGGAGRAALWAGVGW